MATTPVTGDRQLATPERAQAPIRWPHPSSSELLIIALWLAGGAAALVLPALLVSPTTAHAATGKVWTAFSLTVVGAVIMFGATVLQYRRTRDSAILTLGLVPGFSLIIGGVILAVTKVYGVPY